MSLEGRTIAVIGAGIGGLAAATALAQRRAHVQVFEQADALAEVGAGIQVAPNGVAVLEALGMRDAAEACASLPEAVELRDHRGGRLVARLPLGQQCVARYGRPYWQFHRADLLAVLAAAAAEAGVQIRLATSVAEVRPEAEGRALRSADGTRHAGGDRRRRRRPPLGHPQQPLRRAAAPLHRPRRLARPRRRGPSARRAARPAARVTMAPGRHLVTYPLRGGRVVNFVAVEERAAWTAEGWSIPDDPAALRRAFAGWDGAAGELLAAVTACHLWGLFDHAPLPAWTAGRLALLGDACHPMLPFLAQGATMALEDAWVLAAELALAADPARGLSAYEATRLPRATRVQRAAARNGRHLPPAPGAARAGPPRARRRRRRCALATIPALRLAFRRRRDADGLTPREHPPTCQPKKTGERGTHVRRRISDRPRSRSS